MKVILLNLYFYMGYSYRSKRHYYNDTDTNTNEGKIIICLDYLS